MTRRPFVVNVGEELRHPGSQIPLTLSGSLEPGVALPSVAIPDDADVRFDGVVEAQGTTVVVQGTARARWVGDCRRCLRPTDGEVLVDIREIFEPNPVEGETFPLTDDQIDLAPVLRETLALGLPLAPLCAEDCPGPDPEGHPVGAPPDSDESTERRDPRWAALDELRLDQ